MPKRIAYFPHPVSYVVDKLVGLVKGAAIASFSAIGLRVGDGEDATKTLDVVSGDSTTDVRIAAGDGATAFLLRANDGTTQFALKADVPGSTQTIIRVDIGSNGNLLQLGIDGAGVVTITGQLKVTNGMWYGNVTADPTSPPDGSFWYRSDTDEWKRRTNGTTETW